MDRILYTAMSGAKQSLDQQSVVSNNLSNASTSGFRAQLHAMRAVPVQGDGLLPTRTSVVASTPGADFSAGPMNATGRDLDVAMQGDAWLAVQGADGGEAYTRRGDLQVNGNGMITSAGRPVIGEGGPLVVPLGSALSVGADGTISAIGPGESPDTIVEVGRLKMVTPGPDGLLRGDDGLFRARPDAEGEVAALPRDETARLLSGSLEGSNVSTVEAMVSMIDTARRFEMQMKVIGDANDNAQRANNLLSLQG
ncbi:flagellar basal body rod protein FlgF [Parahaliea mediterranea]|uniref:Flagellar basal-body rod protein FlgF n=1 Tax=Parahaliea mediterranea TaxID=651086 RepID=A0A939DCY2_9GAMM|nr:flagellar basal body rod protein FlgF [Parahaliea mediterranea]MBN7795846.1 flagellar basal body rod protein FlgF [Parahaliea mediterranea]